MALTTEQKNRLRETERRARAALREVAKVKKRAGAPPNQYESHRERMAARAAELSESGRDIGELPAVVNADRKAECAASFQLFCEEYFPATFRLEWSPDHLKVIAAIEAAVTKGGLFAFAMPRGSGKTSLVETAALWSIVYGHHDFIAIIGADEEHARTMLESIKVECEVNEALLDDFPEVVYPIVALEKIHQRAGGQLYRGKPTNIQWTANEVQFPTVDGSKASGGIIRVAGITGRIRGMSAKRACDSRKVRPSLVLIDDPQTDESAASPSQVATREAVLKGAILGLAGPGSKISGLCTVTVVKPDDLADRLLDRSQHPSWQGERTKLIYSWPTADDLWSQYAEMRREGQRTGRGTSGADDFYQQHQTEMDAGAVVAWEARKNEDELSAVQHAWNLRIDRGESAFAAEFQNEPVLQATEVGRMQKKELAARIINVPGGVVPIGCDQLTAFVDVQEKVLFWLVAAWNESFGGSIVAYGCYPEQSSAFFEAAHAKRTLALAAKGAGFEASLNAGLEKLSIDLMSREWLREDGTAIRIRQLLIDANWGQSTQTIRTFARRSQFAASILPSHGRGIGASGQPLADKQKGRGDKLGLNWRIGQISAGQRSVIYDTNFWKTFVAARLRLALGDPESISMNKGEHDLLIEHFTAEYPVRTEARGRVVDEWKMGGRDNHWWDCMVGAAVAASIAGVRPQATEAGGRARRKVAMPSSSKGKITVTRRAK
jgi:hypothetical protein